MGTLMVTLIVPLIVILLVPPKPQNVQKLKEFGDRGLERQVFEFFRDCNEHSFCCTAKPA